MVIINKRFCTVRNQKAEYFHIDITGQPIYKERYTYAGDYRDGFACVRLKNGRYQHIDLEGNSLNNCFFEDLGVFHKSIATAKDKQGWFHINEQGEELYKSRFQQVEPFYNGFALVENFEGEKLILGEQGQIILKI